MIAMYYDFVGEGIAISSPQPGLDEGVRGILLNVRHFVFGWKIFKQFIRVVCAGIFESKR